MERIEINDLQFDAMREFLRRFNVKSMFIQDGLEAGHVMFQPVIHGLFGTTMRLDLVITDEGEFFSTSGSK